MRILHILHSHGYGGAENHALTLMAALREAGHEVMYAGPGDSWLAQRCQAAGIPARPVRMSGLADIGSHLALRRTVAQWRPHIVHGHLVRGAHYAGWAAWRQPGAHALCTAHATTAHKHMGRCEAVIAVSGAVRDNLLRHGHATSRIHLIYNGMPDAQRADSAERAALRRELGIGKQAFALVNVGRFVRDKGQDLLVQAMAQAPVQTELFLLGDPGTEFGRHVQQMAGGHGRIHFLGYRDDVPRLLPAFDAYVSSSRREALGLSLVEAAAAALPTIATRVGGVPEVVLDGRTGQLVPTEDAGALARAIAALAATPDAARSLGAAARRHYLDTFTVGHMLAQTLDLYRRLAACP